MQLLVSELVFLHDFKIIKYVLCDVRFLSTFNTYIFAIPTI